MKNNRLTAIITATLLSASAQFAGAQTADLDLGTFDTDQGNTGTMWGSSAATWDASQDATGNGGGSLRIESRWTTDSDTALKTYFCIPGSNPWWYGSTINLSDYKSIQFDLKWDNTSTCTIDQFNDPLTFPGGPDQWSTKGIEIQALANASGGLKGIMSTNIPAAAANGWVRIIIPINPAQADIDPSVGFSFNKWLHNHGAITSPATNYFWIDNVMLEGTAAPPPPPTVALVAATPGLVQHCNANPSYNRQVLRSHAEGGYNLGWVGRSKPVSYSFTIADFPKAGHGGYHVSLAIDPTTSGQYADADWSAANCLWLQIEARADGTAAGQLGYKVDQAGGNSQYYSGPGALLRGDTALVASSAIGTWTLTFTSDTDITLTGPGGISATATLPPEVASLYSTASLFLFTQMGPASNLGQSATISSFSATGVETPFNEDLTDGGLSTPFLRLQSQAYGYDQLNPVNQIFVTSQGKYWLTWSLPDIGFSPVVSTDLAAGLAGWKSLSLGNILASGAARWGLINNLPAGNQAFYGLIKRSFTKLQVLLPGETAAPGTPTGKTGTPIAQTAWAPFIVTVQAVDDDWNPVNSNHSVSLAATPGGNDIIDAAIKSLTAGVATFEVVILEAGSFTFTTQNVTDDTKGPDTSTAVTVN
jgi:hypothetical protein